MTSLSSRAGVLEIGSGQPTVLINEQLRVMNQDPAVLEELKEGRFDRLLDLARVGQQMGMDMVNLLLSHPDLDEVQLLPRVAEEVHEQLGCPISLDTRDPEALEAALDALQPYKCLVNSVSAEPGPLNELLPIASRYGAAVVAMPIGGAGIPDTAAGRIEQARIILEHCREAGIPTEDVIVDGICMASSALPNSMTTALETLQVLAGEMGLATILGIGNAGFGMPDRTVIDLAYLIAAMPWGLDAALVNPNTAGLIETVRGVDFLLDQDQFGLRYIEWYRRGR